MAREKKSKWKWILLGLAAPLGMVVFMIMAVGGGAITSMQGYEESVAEAQASNLQSYLDDISPEQKALVHAARTELDERNGAKTKGADEYVYTLARTTYDIQKKNNPNKPVNITWDSFFVGQMMTNAGIEISTWNQTTSAFATKIHQKGTYHLPEGYIPRKGDIVFFGDEVPSLDNGMTIKAKYCGIVTRVETVVEGTTIKAMRIIVIEGDAEGKIKAGNLDHSTSYVSAYTYDLYDTKGNNHHGYPMNYAAIIGYGKVVNDERKVESTTEESNYKDLYYTIDLQSAYEDAMADKESSQEGETTAS